MFAQLTVGFNKKEPKCFYLGQSNQKLPILTRFLHYDFVDLHIVYMNLVSMAADTASAAKAF